MVGRTLATLAVMMAVAAPVGADDNEVRHSGTIVEVREAGRTVVIEEMVAWEGPPGIVRRMISLTPDASIQLVQRADGWGAARTSLPGWTSESIDAADLRAGDRRGAAGLAREALQLMEEGQQRVQATYRDNYERLAEIKTRYDPENIFHVNQNIRPRSEMRPAA